MGIRTDGVKFCKDCQHCRRFMWVSVALAECRAPEGYTSIDLLTGEKGRAYKYCESHRVSKATEKTCGTEGKWFKERKPIWLRIVQAGAR